MYLGYNTNGLAHHDPVQAIELIGQLGYRGLAITVDHSWLNPHAADLEHQLETFQRLFQVYRLHTVIETGARFLLNPHVKHEPTLISDGAENRNRRVDFLKHCIDMAHVLGSDCVSLWSGRQPETINRQTAMARLTESLKPVIAHAESQGVTIGFEPEPGMLIDTLSAYESLLQSIDSPAFQLTLDVGHLCCQGEVPLADFIERWQHRLVNVHIEDMNAGVHEHLMFGEGQIQFPPVFAALHRIRYAGGVFVELSRHSHNAAEIARRSMAFLAPLLAAGDSPETWRAAGDPLPGESL